MYNSECSVLYYYIKYIHDLHGCKKKKKQRLLKALMRQAMFSGRSLLVQQADTVERRKVKAPSTKDVIGQE